MPKEQHSFEVCTLTAMYTSNGEKNYYSLLRKIPRLMWLKIILQNFNEKT